MIFKTTKQIVNVSRRHFFDKTKLQSFGTTAAVGSFNTFMDT